MVNWTPYLESLCNAYTQWWTFGTLKDVVEPKRFEFDLMVQTVERDTQQRSNEERKVERLSLLEGLKKYAPEHVLLVGRPGSGKSTALVRLLVAEAQQARQNPHSQIPVLVELRTYKVYYKTSVLDLVQASLKRRKLRLNIETIEELLAEGRFLLLMDGINELPDDEARNHIKAFRLDYSDVPMVFTTRDLGVGGDLGIEKKLELQSLTEAEVEKFVQDCMPGGSEERLQQLRQRLRELGQTPFVMWMLYFIVEKTGRVPSGAGSAFREFTQLYERCSKDDVPVSDALSRDWWSRLLEHLAFEMMPAEKPTDFRLTISRREAVDILTNFLDGEKFDKPRDYALRWLEDLLKHHLIQVSSHDQIEFCHQLIQEYYAAEILLQMLLQKPSPVSDETLKREYLNYLKWTEPLALMLELVEDESQAVRVVKLALEVDLRLGARLAGAVKPEFQQKTVSMIAGQEVPDWFKVFLLGETKSPKAADEFMQTIKHPDSSIRSKCVWASRKLGSEAAMPLIFRAIEDSDSHVRETAIRVIGELGSEQAIPLVSQILTKEPIASVREAAVMQVLGKLDSEAAILELLRATQDTEHNAREMAIHYLEEMSRELVIPVLTEALKNKNIDVSLRKSAAKLLGKLGDERIIADLFAAQLDVNIDVCHEAYYALHEIRIRARDKEISVTESQESQEMQRKQQIKMWLRYLNSEEPAQRGNAIYYLTSLLSKEEAVPLATQALNDQDHYVRGHGITSLVRLIGKEAVSLVVNALNDPHYDVRDKSAQELTGLGQNLPDNLEIPEETVSKLIKISNEEQNTYARSITIRTLTNLCSIKPSLILRDDLELAFLNASYSSDNFLRSTAAKGLGKFNSERASIRLLQMIEYDVSFAALSAIESLKNLPSIITAKHLPALRELILTATESFALDAIFTIQERCKFYNYTLTQAHQMEDKLKSDVNRDQVFISYSHRDKKWLDKLQTMLKPMMRNNTILVWDDTKIQVGAKWRDEIEKALARANVAVLMVSANFLASDFIAKHELPPLLNAAEQEGLKVIWVPVGYCLYEETEIEPYQAVHNPSQPLESLKGAKLNQVLAQICREIKAASTATDE